MWMNGWNTEWNLLAQREKSQPCVVNSLIFGIEFLHLMAALVSVTILVLLEHSRGVDALGTT